MTWGSTTSEQIFLQYKKSNTNTFFLLYNISRNTALSCKISSFPTISLVVYSSVSLDPFTISENFGISYLEYLPFLLSTMSVSFDFSTQSNILPGLLLSDTPRSTGCTLSAFFFCIVHTLNIVNFESIENSSAILEKRYSPASTSSLPPIFGRNIRIA